MKSSATPIQTTQALSLAAMLLMLSAPSAQAADVPDFMKIVVANEGAPPPKNKTAFDDIYALNEGMFPIYEQSLATYTQHFRARQNLIMALFSAKGGRFILYRAGQPPLEAESPPAVYRMAKSVGHCAMGRLLTPISKVMRGALSRIWPK